MAGRNVVVFWRGPDQSGTQRTFAISKNAGKTFGAVRSVRIPVLFQLVAITGDAAGNIYYAGTTGFANQIAVVRSNAQVKNFTIAKMRRRRTKLQKLQTRASKIGYDASDNGYYG